MSGRPFLFSLSGATANAKGKAEAQSLLARSRQICEHAASDSGGISVAQHPAPNHAACGKAARLETEPCATEIPARQGPPFSRGGSGGRSRRGAGRGWGADSQKTQELIHGHAGGADEGAQRPDGKFFMLRDGEAGSNAGLHHHQVTSDLSQRLPTRFLKSFRGITAANVREPAHRVRWRPRFPVVRASWGVRRRPSDLQPTAMP